MTAVDPTAAKILAEVELANAAVLPLRGDGGWPVLDPLALRGLAGEIVHTLEPHTEADVAGLLVSILVEFGCLTGSGPHALADSSEHPARLFAVLVGQSSKGRKGSAAKNVERVTAAADRSFARDRRLNGFGSGEALVDALRGGDGNRDPRLLVLEPEFARILNVAARDGSTLSSIIRQGWDGGRLAVRSRSGTTVAENSHLCVLGHITADELRTKLTATEVASGFANRFLFVCVRRSKLLPSGGNLDDGELAPLARNFAAAAAEARKAGMLRRTPPAEALWAEMYQEMAQDLPGGLLGSIVAHDDAQMLRLSVAYTLLDQSRKIDVAHLRAAWALWRYCRASAAYVFGESLGDPVADRLLEAVREAGREGLDGTRQRAVFSRHATGERLDAARSLLERKGLVVCETVQTGGRPSTVLRAAEALSAKALLAQAPNPPDAPSRASSQCAKSAKSRLQGERANGSEAVHCAISAKSAISPDSSEPDDLTERASVPVSYEPQPLSYDPPPVNYRDDFDPDNDYVGYEDEA